jgi:Uma2 family endonuclease
MERELDKPTERTIGTTLIIPTDAPAIQGPKQGEWTYEHWETLLPDDGNRYEIINGVLYMTTAPKNFHQWILGQLFGIVGFPAQQTGLAYAYFSPIGVLMPGVTPVQPDLVIVLKTNQNVIFDGRIRGVPDLIVEVLSPGSIGYDEGVKLDAYASAGVPEYAVIDPKARQVRVYRLVVPGEYGDPTRHNETDIMAFICLPTISFKVSDLFSGTPDTVL